MKLVIIDYDASNLHSVRKALQALGHGPIVSNDPATVAGADAVVLPGVGAAGDAMRHLTELGLVPVPCSATWLRGVPFSASASACS